MKKGVVMFTLGAAIGSFVTWLFVKTKYEKIANEEIESVKEAFSNREKKEEVEEKELTDEEISAKYEEVLHMNGYKNSNVIEKEVEEVEEVPGPYVIPPDEFDEIGYDTVSLVYYTDGVVTDSIGHVIEDIEGTIGAESLDHFGEWEDDSVFVRNERLRIDYEILADYRTYEQYKKFKKAHNRNT